MSSSRRARVRRWNKKVKTTEVETNGDDDVDRE